ncbi:M48 family metallopeptidase [Gottschalkiaceae bacterium SANA]|nr:M48 family metallopeptidase [Gottschalkiaceae bacterium SANA]
MKMEKAITIQVEYRKRRSFELKWINPHELRVRVPLGTSRKTIDQLIQDKDDWINRSRKQMLIRESEQGKNYLEAEVIQYLGKARPFRWEKAQHPFQLHMGFEAVVLTGDGTPEEAQVLIEQTYRELAKEIFQARVSFFAERLGVSVNQIRVKSQKTRWGSCSSKGNLNFNWHAIVMPIEVVDYLVVHECCHLLQMNHSKEFWNLVESICPNYKEERKWLKNHHTQILP